LVYLKLPLARYFEPDRVLPSQRVLVSHVRVRSLREFVAEGVNLTLPRRCRGGQRRSDLHNARARSQEYHGFFCFWGQAIFRIAISHLQDVYRLKALSVRVVDFLTGERL
jgi:hypothetical protein